MNRLVKTIIDRGQGLIEAVSRFPLAVVCLLGATGVVWYMISLNTEPSLLIQKLLFTFGLGAFLSVAAQFSCERFPSLQKSRPLVYLAAALLIGGYYLIIASAPSLDYAVITRTLVAVFAMFCIYIWVPSFKGRVLTNTNTLADFNGIALTHFKAAVTSVLFSAVLSIGIASIIASVDALLFNVNEDAYPYSLSFIWITFATTYYLSRLPQFNSEAEEDRAFLQEAISYPPVLKVLISYIVIPLIAVYSLVLISYFGKIIITFVWPSGLLGPMILAYSAVGLIVLVLASHLEGKAAAIYRQVFPKVLILMVIMQLISVYIRLDAYGITEGRYYVALFGIYSLVCAIVLSFRPVAKSFVIAVLGASFAIVSIIPPVDAFTVSRNSQITRLEQMLTTDGVLADGKIIPNENVSLELRQETTSILNYLERRNYLQYIAWLPAEMKEGDPRSYGRLTADNLEKVFGFEPAYGGVSPDTQYFYAHLDMEKPMTVSGYDVLVATGTYRNMPEGKGLPNIPSHDVQIRGQNYRITVERLTPQEARVSVKDANGIEVVGTNLYEFADTLTGVGTAPKEMMDPEAMTILAEKDGYKLKVMFQHINMNLGTDEYAGVDYDFFVFFGAPAGDKR